MTREEADYSDWGQIEEKNVNVIDVLNKIRTEIIVRAKNVKSIRVDGCCFFTAEEILKIIDKYKIESENK